MVLNHPPIVFIRSWCNWLTFLSDKEASPDSSSGLRTTFLALSNNWPSSSPFQGGNTGSSPVGATKSYLEVKGINLDSRVGKTYCKCRHPKSAVWRIEEVLDSNGQLMRLLHTRRNTPFTFVAEALFSIVRVKIVFFRCSSVGRAAHS